jgi:hypothetical protein
MKLYRLQQISTPSRKPASFSFRLNVLGAPSVPPQEKEHLVGQNALIAKFGLRVPKSAVTSVIHAGARKTIIDEGRSVEKYPPSYQPDDTLIGQVKFALRYEPVYLGILTAAFKACDKAELESWVRSEPNGSYSRRAWFLYEWLTGDRLDLPDAPVVAYVNALDPKFHFTAEGRASRRHRVTDNIPGTPGFAPTIRRISRIEDFVREDLKSEAAAMIADCDPEVLSRAVNYLYTKETKSSFEIEHEVATGQRAERFVVALRAAKSFDPTDIKSLIALQNSIVDQRYAAHDLRDFQNFVGETVGGYREVVHFICPRPEDVAQLLGAWGSMTKRLKGALDPVMAAALVAFGFVFIHPFEDGNGRIHRFLMHHVLSSEGFAPPDTLFPVSAAIVRDRRGYDKALETFSEAIKPHVDWNWGPGQTIQVTNDTADLYRYFDATPLVEFMFAKVADTIRRDLKEEIDFVAVFDAARFALANIVDMPNRRANLLVRLCLQNGGHLSKNKRPDFAELTDDEIAAIEGAIAEVVAAHSAHEPVSSSVK